MKKLFFKYMVLCFLFFNAPDLLKAQIFEDADEQHDEVLDQRESEIFANDQAFGNKKSVSRRGSGGFDSNMTFGGNTPIDGGLGIVVGGLFGYGVRKLRKKRQKSSNVR